MAHEEANDQPGPNLDERAEAIAVAELPEKLGFVEDEELLALHAQIVEVATTNDEAKTGELFMQYCQAAEKIVAQKEGDDFPRATIGFIIAKALLWKEAGRADYYPGDLYDALISAEERGFEEATVIRQAYEKAQAEARAHPEETETADPTSTELATALKDTLSEEDCQELEGMDIEEAVGYAFTLLLEQGIEDPEAFLKEKGILE